MEGALRREASRFLLLLSFSINLYFYLRTGSDGSSAGLDGSDGSGIWGLGVTAAEESRQALEALEAKYGTLEAKYGTLMNAHGALQGQNSELRLWRESSLEEERKRETATTVRDEAFNNLESKYSYLKAQSTAAEEAKEALMLSKNTCQSSLDVLKRKKEGLSSELNDSNRAVEASKEETRSAFTRIQASLSLTITLTLTLTRILTLNLNVTLGW